MEIQRPFRAITPTVDGDVLQVLASSRSSLTAPQLAARIPERSIAGIRLALDRLRSQGIIVVETIGRTSIYALNDRHLLAEPVRVIAAARTTLHQRLTELVQALPTTPHFAALFGSGARGQMRDDSDLDVLIVRPRDSDAAAWDAALADLATQVTALTGNDARIVDISEDDLVSAAYARLIDDVLADGIPLAGERAVLLQARKDQSAP